MDANKGLRFLFYAILNNNSSGEEPLVLKYQREDCSNKIRFNFFMSSFLEYMK